jgi:DNA-binding IclR family transcriptional regulator
MALSMTNRHAQSGTQSIERAMTILRIIASGSPTGLRLKDIANRAELASSTVHRILMTLLNGGLIERRKNGALYVIGSELTLLGLSSRAREFRERAAPALAELSAAVGDAVFLSVRSDLDTVCVDRRIGTYPVQVLTIEIGSRRPLGISANGVAMLSRMRPQAVETILRENTERLSVYKTPLDVLETRINDARKRGYVYSERTTVKGASALAMPICDAVGSPLAAVSTLALASRQPKRRIPELVELLTLASQEIEKAVRGLHIDII